MAQALVTGATSGIGRAIAVALREAGHEVIALGRQVEALKALEREHGIRPIQVDLSDTRSVVQALNGVAIDLLVNNAGIMPPLGNFCDLAETEIERAVSVN